MHDGLDLVPRRRVSHGLVDATGLSGHCAVSGKLTMAEEAERPAALFSHCGRLLRILLFGIRDPRRERWVALTMAMIIRALIYPQTSA